MSYLRELIEHGIMLVSCNKDILRLSMGGSIELLIHSFLIHSIYSSDSHLSHSTPFTKKVGDSRLNYNEKFKIKYNEDSKSSEIKVIKFIISTLFMYIKKKKKKKKKRERSGKQSENRQKKSTQKN